jgi:hypothetical protein
MFFTENGNTTATVMCCPCSPSFGIPAFLDTFTGSLLVLIKLAKAATTSAFGEFSSQGRA